MNCCEVIVENSTQSARLIIIRFLLLVVVSNAEVVCNIEEVGLILEVAVLRKLLELALEQLEKRCNVELCSSRILSSSYGVVWSISHLKDRPSALRSHTILARIVRNFYTEKGS